MFLFDKNLRSAVKPTNLTKKLTLNGETKAYPVYRVKLDCYTSTTRTTISQHG